MKIKPLAKLNRPVRTKPGAASLFVVMFTILLLGIITLGFVRLIVSDTIQTTNTDLSQSAYDSALAGVEDARTALLYYHECLSQGYTAEQNSSNPCRRAIYEMQEGIRTQSCDVVANVLGRTTESDGSVVIKESSLDENQSSSMLQAYTCVKISEELEDYRTTLDSVSRTRIIPIRSDHLNANEGANITSVDLIKSLRIRWTPTNGATFDANAGLISVRLIQANQSFTLSDFYANNGDTTDRAVMYLKANYPGSSNYSAATNNLTAAQAAATNNKAPNSYFQARCTTAATFHCYMDVEFPYPIRGQDRNEGATFLVITSPQGTPSMDFSVSLCTGTICEESGNQLTNDVAFSGVQARIDSTGRANDLYRRVESRVELVDINYPYPEFSIEQKDVAGGVSKSFWVTKNCWYYVNGAQGVCNNYEENSSLAGS